MSHSNRPDKNCESLEEILKALGDESNIGKKNTWVAKNYSLAALIVDLKKLQEKG